MIRSVQKLDWKYGRGRPEAFSDEEDHAFIMRIRISIAADGGERRSQFSVVDVAAGHTERFATYEHAAEWLAHNVQRIVAGPAAGPADT